MTIPTLMYLLLVLVQSGDRRAASEDDSGEDMGNDSNGAHSPSRRSGRKTPRKRSGLIFISRFPLAHCHHDTTSDRLLLLE
jgi:hypothetical protein